MKREYFKTRKEAEERANALLFQDRQNPLTMVTKSYTLNMPNGNITLYDYAGGSPIRNRARRTIKRKR